MLPAGSYNGVGSRATVTEQPDGQQTPGSAALSSVLPVVSALRGVFLLV